MAQDPREDMDMLRVMAPQLNAATAEATAVVLEVDQFLGEELGIGVSSASRAFDTQPATSDDGRELLVTSHLAYGRVAGKNRLYVLRATLETNEWKEQVTKVVAEERTPWGACPREIKLQSFAMLPELLASLASRVDEVASQTSRTVEKVRELLDAMRQPTAPPLGPPQRLPEPEPEDEAPRPLEELSVHSAPDLFKRPRAAR
jgi:hypothetical protein